MIKSESKERLLAYLLIVNSSNTSTHESLKNNLLEAFIARRDEYPETRSDAIALLNKYDERKPPPTMAASKGTAFAQKGQKAKKKSDEKKKDESKDDKSKTDKDFWKDKQCFICDKKGHPASKCPSKKKKSTDSDDSSISSKSDRVDQLEKKFKKQFTQLKAQIEADEDISDSDEEQSHFQFMQHFCLLNQYVPPVERHAEVALKQSKGKLSDINL